jgi:MFS superfamily sulfate permease-like transporter
LLVAVVTVSFAVAPSLWVDWVRFLTTTKPNADHGVSLPPLVTAVVLVGGLGLVVVAARTGRYWLLAPATIMLSPTIGVNTFSVLAAVPRLLRASEPRRLPADSPP